MSGTLAVTQEQGFWDEKQLAALKQIGLANAPKGELAVLLHYSQKTGLDPFARQIYMIERGGKFTIQTSIDGFRIIAQRSGKYAGQTKTEWCGEDGVWKEVWLAKEFPAAARVGVHGVGFVEPVYSIAKWDSYAQPNSPMWKKMPDLMLAKCAEALALRKAFPQDLSGIYTSDEMEQSEPVSRFVASSAAGLKVVSNPTIEVAAPVEIKEINWDEIMDTFIQCDSKETYRDLWIKCGEAVLDTIVPNPDFDGKTLRELILYEISELDSASKLQEWKV